MRRNLLPVVGTLIALWFAAAAWAVDQPLLLMELPDEGPVSATVKAAYTALQPQYDIEWVKVHSAAQRERAPAAIILTTGAKLLREVDVNLAEFAQNGGGVVLVAPLGSDQRETANATLRAFGVRVAPLEKSAGHDLKLLPHAVTEDVGDLPDRGMKAGLVSDSLEPIVTLNEDPLAVAGMVGRGRVVVLAQPLLATGTPSRAAGSPQALLLANAITWAAGRGLAPAESNPAAGEPSAAPPGATDLAPTILTDMPTLPAWQAIVDAATRQLATLNLRMEPLGYELGKKTLATALAARPALVVLTPYRDLEEPELPALAEYVRAGGSLLVLEYCADTDDKAAVKKVASLNRALGEFGISYTLGRPAGQGVAKRHPITEGLGQPGRVGAGGSVWAYAQWPLVTVGECVAASAHEFREGRIVVLDARALLPPKEKQQANSYEWFARLLLSSARWLTGR